MARSAARCSTGWWVGRPHPGRWSRWARRRWRAATRETVLRRDGTGVVTDSSCAATSGRWYSPYDGATWTAASDVDIDHIVPLAEAWRSGASSGLDPLG
jgi:hypothetical protein